VSIFIVLISIFMYYIRGQGYMNFLSKFYNKLLDQNNNQAST